MESAEPIPQKVSQEDPIFALENYADRLANIVLARLNERIRERQKALEDVRVLYNKQEDEQSSEEVRVLQSLREDDFQALQKNKVINDAEFAALDKAFLTFEKAKPDLTPSEIENEKTLLQDAVKRLNLSSRIGEKILAVREEDQRKSEGRKEKIGVLEKRISEIESDDRVIQLLRADAETEFLSLDTKNADREIFQNFIREKDQQRKEETATLFYEKYNRKVSNALSRYVYGRMGTKYNRDTIDEIAEEATHVALSKILLKHAEKLADSAEASSFSSFYSYILTSAYHAYIDISRRKNPLELSEYESETALNNLPWDAPTPEEIQMKRELTVIEQAALQRELAYLTEGQQKIMTLLLKGVSREEIMAELNIKRNALDQNISRAVQRIVGDEPRIRESFGTL